MTFSYAVESETAAGSLPPLSVNGYNAAYTGRTVLPTVKICHGRLVPEALL